MTRLSGTLLAATALFAAALAVPLGGAHSGPQTCTDLTAVHIYYGASGSLGGTGANAYFYANAGAVYDTCTAVTDSSCDNPPPPPKGDPGVVLPIGASVAAAAVGDCDPESGNGLALLPGGDYVSCGPYAAHHSWGVGASYDATDHQASVLYIAGTDGPVVVLDPVTLQPVPQGACQVNGVVSSDYNNDPMDCIGSLGFDDASAGVHFPSLVGLASASYSGANWRNPATTPPHAMPGSSGPQVGAECHGWDGATWVSIFSGTAVIGGVTYAAAPVVGDISG